MRFIDRAGTATEVWQIAQLKLSNPSDETELLGKTPMDSPFSRPTLMVIHCMSVASLGAGNEDGVNADIEEVRDLLIARFKMTRAEADDAIENAKKEGCMEPGDPQP